MKLLSIVWRNFMRFRYAKLTLTGAGMVMIEGVNKDDRSATSNGAGKSTIVYALEWCLYGVTGHEPASEGDDVVNETRAKNCSVSVLFEVNDTIYEVTRRRMWKKGGKAVQLNLTKIGHYEMTKGKIADTQEVIDKLIGMSRQVFHQSCVFGQGRAYRFSKLTDAEKKNVFDEMLGSELYAKAGALASAQLAETDGEIDRCARTIEDASESLQEARERFGKLKLKETETNAQTRADKAELKSDLKKLERQRASYGDAESVLRDARDLWNTAKEQLDKALIQRRTAQAEHRALEAKALELGRAKLAMQKLEAKDCVVCKQRVSASHVSAQIEVLDLDGAKVDAELAAKEVLLKKLQRKHDVAIEHESAFGGQYEAAKENQSKVRVLDEKIMNKRERFHLRGMQQEDFSDLIEAERKRIVKCKVKRKQAAQMKKLAEERKQRLEFWQHGFSAKGLRSLMLDAVLPYLNAKLENYTNALTAGNVQVRFKTQRKLKSGALREDFHIEVKNRHGSKKYGMNSAGERAKVDLVVGLALQDMAASRSRVPINVAFFDECFDGLDEQGIDRAVQVLSQLNRESAFVITHNSALKSFFSKRIVVTKKNGISILEES